MVYYKINLRHPFTMLIAGPTGCVRTEFVKKLIDNEQIVSKPIPECVVIFMVSIKRNSMILKC